MITRKGDHQYRTRVKVCGMTRLQDALTAVRYGVDGLGFIFNEKSPRNITVNEASNIIKNLPPFIDKIGVFVNAPLAELISASKTGLSYAQLHGSESVEYCTEVRRLLPHLGLIKAFRIGADSSAEVFSIYRDCVDGYLLDTYVKGASGGTGEVFDWSIIEKLELQLPVFLAGGLAPENIIEAIKSVRPFAVDINSGIETRPGVKDHQRLQEVMHLVSQTVIE